MKKAHLRPKCLIEKNSIRDFGEEIGYTQGLGIAYSVDFDTFGELLQKIFKKKDKKSIKKEEPKDNKTKTDESKFSDNSIGLKKK